MACALEEIKHPIWMLTKNVLFFFYTWGHHYYNLDKIHYLNLFLSFGKHNFFRIFVYNFLVNQANSLNWLIYSSNESYE